MAKKGKTQDESVVGTVFGKKRVPKGKQRELQPELDATDGESSDAKVVEPKSSPTKFSNVIKCGCCMGLAREVGQLVCVDGNMVCKPCVGSWVDRHRWKGADCALCDVGLPYFFHDVMTPTLERYAATKLPQATMKQIRHINSQRANFRTDVGMNVMDALIDDTPAVASQEHDRCHEVRDDAAAAAGSFAKQNLKYVQNAFSWSLVPSPSFRAQVLCIRNNLVPLQTLLDRHLYLGSRNLELKQRSKESKSKQSGDIAPVGFNRDFLILVAARLTEKLEPMRLLRLLHHKSEMWSLLPESDRDMGVVLNWCTFPVAFIMMRFLLFECCQMFCT